MSDSEQILYRCSCPEILRIIQGVEYQVGYETLGHLEGLVWHASEGLATEALQTSMQ